MDSHCSHNRISINSILSSTSNRPTHRNSHDNPSSTVASTTHQNASSNSKCDFTNPSWECRSSDDSNPRQFYLTMALEELDPWYSCSYHHSFNWTFATSSVYNCNPPFRE